MLIASSSVEPSLVISTKLYYFDIKSSFLWSIETCPNVTLESKKKCSTKYHQQEKVLIVHLAFWYQSSVFEGPLSCRPKMVDIINDASVLHNYIRRHNGGLSTALTEQELITAYNLLPQPPRQIQGRTINNSPGIESRALSTLLRSKMPQNRCVMCLYNASQQYL